MTRLAVPTGILWLALGLARASLSAADCNGNEIDDALDLAPAAKLRELPTSADVFFSLPVALNGGAVMDVLAIELQQLVLHANDGDGAFERRQALPDGTEVRAFAVADLDFDGTLDIAVIHHGRTGLYTYFGIRDRAFRAGPILEIGDRQSHLAVLDLDGDGDRDFVVGSAFERQLLPVRNVQPLGLRRERAVFVEGELGAIASGDLNGDGYVDVAAVLRELEGSVTILNSNGAGGLILDRSIGELGLPVDAIVLDLDGDASLDVAVADFGGLAYALNNGLGTFGELRRHEVFPDRPGSVAGGDLDQDGHADLVLGLEDAVGLRTFLGKGSQGIAPFQAFFGARHFARVGQLDGDGAPDVVFGGMRPGVLFNRGRGRFEGHRLLLLEENLQPSSLAAGDLDGDGDLDLAVGSKTREQLETHFLDDRSIVRWSKLLTGLQIDAVILEDIDGDGATDLSARDARENKLWQARNDGRGALTVQASFVLRGEGPLLAVDLNGDAISEYVALDTQSIVVNEKAGAAEVLETTLYPLPARPVALEAADVDRDGDLDIACANSLEVPDGEADNVSILLNDGGGRLGPGRHFALDRGPSRLASADVDGDAALDLLASHPVSRSLLVLHGDGSGAFPRSLRFQSQDWIELLAPGDFDDDGALDLGFVERDVNVVSLAHRLGKAPQLLPIKHEIEGIPSALLALDFDADGDDEVLVACAVGSLVSLLDLSSPPWSKDGDRDGIPDECAGPRFRRGDVDANARLELNDAVALLRFLFLDGAAPPCAEAADILADGALDIGDPVSFLGFLYLGSFRPAAPSASCGAVPASRMLLGCELSTGGCSGEG